MPGLRLLARAGAGLEVGVGFLKVTLSMREKDGWGIGRLEAWRDAKDLNSERRQKRDGASLAPNTMPMGMTRKEEMANEYAHATSG